MKKRHSLHRGNQRLRYLPAALLLTMVTTASLVSCDDIFNSIFDTGAPTSLSASDGKYANRIEVSWSAPSLSSDKWKDSKVTGYKVEWEWSGSPGSGYDELGAGATSSTINVKAEYRAKEYSVIVTTEIDGVYEGSASDTGFALETFDLIWQDGGADYSFSGDDRWYVTMLQKGFRYDFVFAPGELSKIEFYDFGSLDSIHETTDIIVSGSDEVLSWVCDEDGARHKFYVRVVPSVPAVAPDTTSFRASFGF